MIRKIADLIRELQKAEIAQIENTGIKHAPTIGEMYEGLTAEIVNELIPMEADLRVVSGFVNDGRGKQSGQIDCMLVSGSGTPIPHTNHFIWHVKDVIAVLEVKKRLFSSELQDAHMQLRGVLYLHDNHLEQSSDTDTPYDIEPSLYAFGQITGCIAPSLNEAGKLPIHLEMIYRSLVVEQISPLRILFSYSGYKSEASLRKGFVGFVRKNLRKHGFGGSSFPNLIICGDYSLLKTNGHPYSLPLRGEDWLVFASSRENPLIFLLELIWTRLSYRLPMPLWFDADLEMERVLPLLWGRAVKIGTKIAWMYKVQKLKRSDHPGKSASRAEWAPHFVSQYQFVLMNALCRYGELPINSAFVEGNSTQQDKADLEDLFAKRLIGQDGDKIVLLTRSCQCLIMPEEGYVVADNSSGRLTAWLNKKTLNIG